jgi:hypothetical protein
VLRQCLQPHYVQASVTSVLKTTLRTALCYFSAYNHITYGPVLLQCLQPHYVQTCVTSELTTTLRRGLCYFSAYNHITYRPVLLQCLQGRSIFWKTSQSINCLFLHFEPYGLHDAKPQVSVSRYCLDHSASLDRYFTFLLFRSSPSAYWLF